MSTYKCLLSEESVQHKIKFPGITLAFAFSARRVDLIYIHFEETHLDGNNCKCNVHNKSAISSI